MHLLHQRVGVDRDALLLQAALGELGDVGVLGRQHPLERLEQQHLDAEPGVGRRDLRARRAGADDGHRLRQLLDLLGADHPAAELGAGDRLLDRARGQHDRLRRDPLPAHGDGALPRQHTLALDQLDLVLLEQARDAARERRDHLLAARHHRAEVDLGLADLDPELTRVADLREHVGHAQHRLGGDAGVVQAASADPVLLDHGGLHPELGGPDRGHVAARSGADHHAVIGGFGHSSEPI